MFKGQVKSLAGVKKECKVGKTAAMSVARGTDDETNYFIENFLREEYFNDFV